MAVSFVDFVVDNRVMTVLVVNLDGCYYVLPTFLMSRITLFWAKPPCGSRRQMEVESSSAMEKEREKKREQ